MKKGLTKEQIVTEAVGLVACGGYESFSLRELAGHLGVKPASLYNHVGGVEEIYVSIAERAADMMEAALREATKGKSKETAFLDGAYAYRRFAEEHRELYKALISIPKLDNERIEATGYKSFAPFLEIIHGYGLDGADSTHYLRIFRSMIHGYIELCERGFMTHGNADKNDSFSFMVKLYLHNLDEHARKKEENKRK